MANLNKINDGCYECNGVVVQSIGPDEYQIHFLNGDVRVRLDPKKPIALGTGCGSGKTTATCLLMLLRLGKGSLYITNLTDDLDRVYYWFRDNVFGKISFTDKNGITRMFTSEDIFNLHNSPIYHKVPVIDQLGNQICDENGKPMYRKIFDNGANIDAYRADHSILKEYEIVLATSHKFMNENPIDLTRFGDPNKSFTGNVYSLQEKAMTGIIGSYPIRGGIFIDEAMTKGTLKKKFSKMDVEYLGKFSFFPTGDPDNPIAYYSQPIYDEFVCKYNELLRMNPGLMVSKSDELKNKLVGDALYTNYSEIWRDRIRDKNESEVTISNNITAFLVNGSRIPIVLAEGTAEYLFLDTIDERTGIKVQKTNGFELVTYKNKYNSPINIEIFSNPLTSRRITRSEISRIFGTDQFDLIGMIDGLANNIQEIINRADVTKVLIFGWMNLKVTEGKKINSNTSLLTTELNSRFDLIEYIKSRILIPEGKEVSFSHYMSGLDKATNEFRDYDSIVLAGYFRIPNSAVAEKNYEIGYNATPESFIMHQVIQAICRTRIRNHKGEPINIFLSDDWPEWVKVQIEKHLGNESIGMKVIQKDTTLDWIPNKWKDQVKILMEYDEKFKEAIETKTSYNMNITLDEIYKIIPVSRKEISKYKFLVKFLGSISINLFIDSGLYYIKKSPRKVNLA